MSSPSPDALATAQLALAADPTNAGLQTELGMALFFQERYHEALAVFQQALARDPDAVAAHNGVGRVYYHLGPPEAAIEAYTRAITIDPHYIPGYWGLGIIYFAQLGRYADALATFQRGLALNPQEVGFYNGIGQAYARQGLFDEAITAFETSARLDPTDPEGECNLGLLYLYLRQYPAARAATQAAITRAPEQAWLHRVLGFIHDRLGAADAAVSALEQATLLDPQDYEARAGLARVYRAVGRTAEAAAQEAIGRRLAADADEYGRACLEAVLGNLDTAIELLEVALAQRQLTPGWARIDPEFTYLQDDPRYQALLSREYIEA